MPSWDLVIAGLSIWFARIVRRFIRVFRIYLHFSDNYTTSCGSLGAIMILLVWLYVVGLAYLIGGEINAEIERAEKANEFVGATAKLES